MATVLRLGGAILALALMGSGCTTLTNARDRIVKREARCPDVTAEIYFEPNSAEVTDEGRAVLRAAREQTLGCKVESVAVLGLADAAGAPGANMDLSRRRAAAVSQALTATGLPAAELDLSAAGQSGSVTAHGETLPLRRRADVVLKLSSPRR